MHSQREKKGRGRIILPQIHLFYRAYMFNVISFLWNIDFYPVRNETSMVKNILQITGQASRLMVTVQGLLGFLPCWDGWQREGLQDVGTLGCRYRLEAPCGRQNS